MKRVVTTVAAVLAVAAALLTVPTQASAATAWVSDQTVIDKLAVSEPLNRILAVGDGSLVQFNATTGAIVHTTAIGPGSADITVSTDGATAFVSATEAHTIKVIDVASGSVTRTYSIPAFDCAIDLSPSKGRLYFIRCNNGTAFLGWIDLSEPGNVIHDGPDAGIEDESIQRIEASEDGSQLFMRMLASREIRVYSSSTSGLTLTASRSDLNVSEMSLDADGEHLVLMGYQSVRFVRRSDLGVDSTKRIIAGRLLSGVGGAFLVDVDSRCPFDVYGRDALTRSQVQVEGNWCPYTVPAWLGSSLVTAMHNDVGTFTVVVNEGVTAWRTNLSLAARKFLRPGGGALIHGRIDVSHYNDELPGPPPVGYDVAVTQTIDGITKDVPSVKVAADGTFSVVDTNPGKPGDAISYSFALAGDETYLSTDPIEASYHYGGVPWDFNSDGYADLAVGAPLENVGSIVDAGSVTVVPGGASGATGAGAVTWTQDSAGVVGSSETGDQFGYALTSGDYDGDGYADLAIAANGEDVGTIKNVGSVTVLRGSATGLTGTGSYIATTSVTSRTNLFAGEAVASLDYNADGFDDLAVGLVGNDAMAVFKGSPSGATKLGASFSEDTTGVPGTRHLGEGFGGSLAAGDFDGDGRDDLAVGIRYDYDSHGYSTGAVVIFPGADTSFDFARSRRFTPDTTGIVGSSHTFGSKDASDEFGAILAAGDLDGDGIDDLVASAMGAPVVSSDGVKHEDAGQVHVLFGSSSGITATGNRVINQETAGVPGTAQRSDLFGRSLDIGLDRTGSAETLAVGTAGDQSVTLFPAGNAAGSLSITQDTTGLPGSTETGDDFSAFVRFLTVHGAGPADLAVSADGENSASGALWIIPSTATGVSPATGAVMLTEDSPGIPGSAESGDRWGWLGDSH